jgi:phosphatidate cytidylyltransferase
MSGEGGRASPKRSSPWRDLRVRFLSAAVLAPAALACIWAGGAIWAVTVTLTAAGLIAEFLAMSRSRRSAPDRVAAILYIALASLSLLLLRRGPHGLADMLFLVLVVWAADIGAYLVGRWAGGPRLAPTLSPGKTWSGAAGGLVCAIAAGTALCIAVSAPRLAAAAAVALLLSLAEQAGDLFESAVKRRYGVKDSGSIIPGHGGLLDRLDGLLAASPVALAVTLASGGALPFWS